MNFPYHLVDPAKKIGSSRPKQKRFLYDLKREQNDSIRPRQTRLAQFLIIDLWF